MSKVTGVSQLDCAGRSPLLVTPWVYIILLCTCVCMFYKKFELEFPQTLANGFQTHIVNVTKKCTVKSRKYIIALRPH